MYTCPTSAAQVAEYKEERAKAQDGFMVTDVMGDG
jgi:hypothetical protein